MICVSVIDTNTLISVLEHSRFFFLYDHCTTGHEVPVTSVPTEAGTQVPLYIVIEVVCFISLSQQSSCETVSIKQFLSCGRSSYADQR